MRDANGDIWLILSDHPPYGRRGRLLTLQRQRDHWTVLEAVDQLTTVGFVLVQRREA